jgi:hypothetical protein
MTKKKSSYLILTGIFFLGGLFTGGCGTFNLFNNDFLNQYQPLGQTSLNTLQAKGPVTIVLENLTAEAKHQENAMFTVYYIDEQGNQQTLTPQTPLKAVPASLPNPADPTHPFDPRNPSDPHFDPSYRQVYVLDCGVKEIWFSGTVNRTQINSGTATVNLGNQQSQSITFCSALVTKTGTAPNVKLITNQFQAFPAVQIPPAHLQEKAHFQCGDVIVVGLLDQMNAAKAMIPMSLTCDYTDLNSLPQTFPPTDPNLFPPGANPLYIFNPTHSLLLAEYQYPASYVIIPIALPNMAGVNTVLPLMQQVAAEYAEKNPSGTSNTTSSTQTNKK